MERAKFFNFTTFFITWFCAADSIRKSEEDDTNHKVPKTSSAKKVVQKTWTQQVMSNLTTSQFKSMLPCSMAEIPSSLHHLSCAMVFGEGRFTSQKEALVHSARCPKWKPWGPGLRTKLLHPLAPWSGGGPVLFCEIQNQPQEMLNFPRSPESCFCKLDLKKGFGIAVIFKLLCSYQHLCLLACSPVPKDQHPNRCHHLMLFFPYRMAKSATCISTINWRLTQHCSSRYYFLWLRYVEQSSHGTEFCAGQQASPFEKQGWRQRVLTL